MKPIIGVVLKPDKNIMEKNVQIVYNNVYKALNDYGAYTVGIINDSLSLDLLNLCDGFVLQGGNNATEFDYELIKKCYELNIPLLGICLGMQTIGEVFGGNLKETIITVHNPLDKLKLHNITIYKNTKLFDIIGEYNISVNSRHNYEIKGTNLVVSARSDDGVIEAIEDSNKKFFIGVEWHPEDMVNFDDYSKKVFKYFINICSKKD